MSVTQLCAKRVSGASIFSWIGVTTFPTSKSTSDCKNRKVDDFWYESHYKQKPLNCRRTFSFTEAWIIDEHSAAQFVWISEETWLSDWMFRKVNIQPSITSLNKRLSKIKMDFVWVADCSDRKGWGISYEALTDTSISKQEEAWK